MLDRDIEFAAWIKDVPVVEESRVGVPERTLQPQASASAEIVPANERV
jgi:hypothetical protein